MKIQVALAFVIIGIVLLLIGTNSWDAIQSAFSKLFSGQFSDHTMWLILGGTLCLVLGFFGCFYGKRV
jgi:uncharacterized membrane protein YidH (DUF202 family)